MALWMSSISGLSVSLLRGSNLFPPFLSPPPWLIFSLLFPPNDLSKITIDLLFLPLPTIENKSRYLKSKEIGREGGWKILFVNPENVWPTLVKKDLVSKREIYVLFSTLMIYLDLLIEFFELEAEG